MQQIQGAESPVSLHIRRGDSARIHGGKDALPLTYQRNAIEAVRQRVANPTFFVFSDDLPYCRKHLPGHVKAVFVDHNDALNSHEDLRLMAACRHNIIANSSFSWWGAWLNPNPAKIVCAPSVWRDEAISRQILPPDWIPLQPTAGAGETAPGGPAPALAALRPLSNRLRRAGRSLLRLTLTYAVGSSLSSTTSISSASGRAIMQSSAAVESTARAITEFRHGSVVTTNASRCLG